jgi:hypothetical protein
LKRGSLSLNESVTYWNRIFELQVCASEDE